MLGVLFTVYEDAVSVGQRAIVPSQKPPLQTTVPSFRIVIGKSNFLIDLSTMSMPFSRSLPLNLALLSEPREKGVAGLLS